MNWLKNVIRNLSDVSGVHKISLQFFYYMECKLFTFGMLVVFGTVSIVLVLYFRLVIHTNSSTELHVLTFTCLSTPRANFSTASPHTSVCACASDTPFK